MPTKQKVNCQVYTNKFKLVVLSYSEKTSGGYALREVMYVRVVMHIYSALAKGCQSCVISAGVVVG